MCSGSVNAAATQKAPKGCTSLTCNLLYGEMGIPEYWIVDYVGLGGRKFIGYPKQPTLSLCQFVEGEYQVRLFRERDRIESFLFPELDLTVEQVFQARL